MKNWIRKSKKIIIMESFAILLLVFLDQITKLLAERKLANGSVKIIDGVFELYYLKNQSAAFSLDPVTLLNNIFHFSYFTEHPESFLNCKMWFFYIFTILVSVLIFMLLLRIPAGKRYLIMNWVCILFISGAVGNLIDRIRQKYVIDFFYFSLIDFPVFNVADIYVTVAAAAFIIFGIFFYKEDDFKAMFSSKEKGK